MTSSSALALLTLRLGGPSYATLASGLSTLRSGLSSAWLQTGLVQRRSSTAASGTGHLQITVEPLSENHEGVSVVSINRPETKNAIGRQLLKELQEAIDMLRQERSTRCVIIRSLVDGVFCAGADLKERNKMTQQEAAEFVAQLRRTFTELQALPMPTIAAVDGLALGGGAELALACDMRVVSTAATLAFPETHLGIIPGAGGTQRLPRIIGASRAKRLIFTAQRVSGAEALEMGLADELVQAVAASAAGGSGTTSSANSSSGTNGGSSGSSSSGTEGGRTDPAYSKALEIAASIRRAAPLALHQAKAAINMGLDTDLHSGLRAEELAYARLLMSKDRLEGLAAFAEKRAPRYTGE